MPIATIHTSPSISLPLSSSSNNPLPQLLRLPSGLAILELQGTLNFPDSSTTSSNTQKIGTLVFPNATSSGDDIKQLKTVWLYVGKHQRLTGEVKALGKPLAVLRRRSKDEDEDAVMGGVEGGVEGGDEELEIVDVVRYKIIFSSRPEPVTSI